MGVRSVAVVGRDAPLWIMALGLRRALASLGVTVQAIELPSLLAPGEAYAALPSLANLHTLLGLNEAALFTHCAAVPSLGQQFVGWSPGQPDLVHGYDVSRPAINDIDFVQFWSLARRQGMQLPFEHFSLAAAAARHGRMHGGKCAATGQGLSPGYHLDARAYAALLRQGCVAAGVAVTPSATVAVERDGEILRAVTLADGARIEADLFVDASGVERVLIGDAGFEVWGGFPADHMLTGTLPRRDPLPAHARIEAVATGWVGLFPLQNTTALAGHFAGGSDAAAAAAQLLAEAGIAAPADLAVRPFAAGALQRSWVGNCVAVADAGAALERIDAVELQLVQVALSNLVAWWPVARDAMPEAGEYDRAMQSHIGNIRDFQQAHYRLSGRSEPFWTGARAGPAPARLAGRIALFGTRGIVSHFDDETFLPQSWAAMLAGHGLVPAESDPAVARTPQEEQIGKVRELLRLIAEDVRAMPDVAAFVAAKRAGR